MKLIHKIFIICLMLLVTLGWGQAAFAAKTLNLGTGSVSNTGDDAARTATLDVTLKGGAHDVNGLVFTLTYNPAVLTFEGLEKGSMDIDDGADYDSANPPSAATIGSTLYYQANNKPSQGIVMVAGAAANFFTTTAVADFVPFRAKFRVKPGIGSGKYPIGFQKTIIGPDTAKNAGYLNPTVLAVAAGLDPAKDPTTAQSFEVGFVSGQINVAGGGYEVAGTAVYGTSPKTNAVNAEANLLALVNAGEFKAATIQVDKNGAYSFTSIPKGTYRIEIVSTKSGFQKRAVSTSFDVVDAKKTVPEILLAAFEQKSGKITINTSSDNLSGLRVEIRDGDGKVIGTAAVDAQGNFVTPPLPASGYTIWAVYGNAEKNITAKLTDNWTLDLGTVSGTLTGLAAGQKVEVLIRSSSVKLQKAVQLTGANPYTLPNLLPAADYILSVTGEGIGPVYYDGATPGGTELFSSAAPVNVVAASDNPGKDFDFTANVLATISGKITLNGTPVKDALVKANNFNFVNWKIGDATSDADGTFTIKVAKSADYYVYFKHENLTYYYKNGVTARSAATLVDVTQANAADIDIPVVLATPDTARLEGYVTLSGSHDDGGFPLKNYLVALFTSDNQPLPFNTRTQNDGKYLFDKMPPGSYNVGLLPPPPYARQFKNGVVLTNDTTATASFIVDQNYRITGDVMAADVANTPVVGARVDIVKSNGGKLRSGVLTDTNGGYTLVDIPSGVYTLIASHRDYVTKSQEETVRANHTAPTILMTAGAAIEGVVKDSDGDPVEGVTVTLRGQGYTKVTRTDKEGKYQFKGLAAGKPHIIKASKGTLYAPLEAADVDPISQGSTRTHNMTLVIPDFSYTFSGTVKEGSTPVADAYVMLSSSLKKYKKVVFTDKTGQFSFGNVLDGDDYVLLVLPGEKKPEIQETIGAIKANKTDHEVVIPALATIQGTITLSPADPTASVVAGAYDPATGMLHEVKGQNTGDATFTYSIKVKSGVVYKVFAQDEDGNYPIQYYVQGAAPGTYDLASDVTNDTSGVDITLTKN